MAVAVSVPARQKPSSDASLFTLCPFWSSRNANQSSSKTVSSVARSLLPPRRRLRLDPSNYLYFPYEPGKQVRSAVRLKNTSKSHVAFKFQTTAPKSCYMRPPGGILAPGESLIATVFKFVEQPENNEKLSDQKHKVKFKIMSLKVKEGVDYVPELATFNRPTATSLEVTLNGALRTKVDNRGVDVMVAFYEAGLVTDCPRGENKGHVLSNDYVVRKLEKLCTVKDHPAKKTGLGTVTLSLWDTFNSSRCGMTVFVQSSSHQIFGSHNFLLPDDM